MNLFDRVMPAVGALCVLALAIVFAGDAIERIVGVQAAVLFAVASLAAACLILLASTVAGRRGMPLKVLIVLSTALLATTIAWIAHLESSAPSQNSATVLGMLPSTSLLLFGVFGTGMLLVIAVVALFRRSVFGRDEDERLARAPEAGDRASGPDG